LVTTLRRRARTSSIVCSLGTRPAHNVPTDASGGDSISIPLGLLDVLAKVLNGRR
jgi:hypothetical protein